MAPCDSLFSVLVAFFSHHLDRSGGAASCGVEAREIFRDYAAREINLLLWFFLIAVTALLVRKLVMLLELWLKGSRISGPPCPSFIHGHSKLFAGNNPQEDLKDLLSKSHEKYGSVVKLWLAPDQLLVSIKDLVLIKDMLVKAADKLPLTGRAYRLAFGRSNFFVSSYEKVQRRRQSLAVELNRNLLERANLMAGMVLGSIKDKLSGFSSEQSLDCQRISQHIAFSFLGCMFFGNAFFAWSKANVYEDLLSRIAKDTCFWASYGVTPFWKCGFWKYQNLCTKLKNLTQDIVLQCRKNYRLLCHNESTATVEKSEFADQSAVGVPSPGYSYVQESSGCLNMEEDPCGNVTGVMFHGYLTTAGLISNILARLVMKPELQDKLYSEIAKVRKGSKKQNYENVSHMHLLLATVYESIRLLPAAPLLQRCSLQKDLKLKNGVTIPAGAMLVAPVQLVQTDEFIWGNDAAEFNPYRFLSKVEDSEEKSYVLSDLNENAAFLSFGSGIRSCIGRKFAIFGIAAILASLLEHYEMRLQPGCSVNLKPSVDNCVLQLLPSPKIVFLPRSA